MAKYMKTEKGYQEIEMINSNKMDKNNPVGTGSFSMGRKAGTTVGDYSHAEGSDTTASGEDSHAEGYRTTASGPSSHAEGSSTKAYGGSSHAEGNNTTASGEDSHAEGNNTTASGEDSHAEGNNTTASGDYSHAEGFHTTATSIYQHSQGKYNIEDTLNKYAHIVGNGEDGTSRSNAHTLDWSGNAWFAGDVYVGSTSGTNKDDGSKKLATEDYVKEFIESNPPKITETDPTVPAWAKTPEKPSYTAAEVGALPDTYTPPVDAALSETSTNPVQNKIVAAKLSEVESIAKGRATGHVFETETDMRNWIASNADDLNAGDNLYIRATDVPDYWWDGTSAQPLETQKVDLTEYAKKSEVPAVDATLTKSGQAADASEVGKEIRTVSGKIPTVFDWAKKELFDKADLVDPAGINSFLTIDGVEYYRYHCGPNNFEWNNPKPYPGSVTITARAVSQYGGTNGTRLLTIYDDGTYGPTLYVIVGGESKTVTVTTDPDKTLAKITGNYDMENWALLDMSVMSCVANYNTGLPLANSNAPGGVITDPATEEYTVPAKIGKNGKMYVPHIPVVDATLTQSGQAADAAKVGEELRSLSGKMVQSVNNQKPDENGNVTVEAGGGETAFTLIDSGEIADGTVSLEFGNLEKYSEIACCFSLIRNNNNSTSGVSLYVNGFNIVSGGNYFIVHNQETYPTISIKKVSENRILCMANGAELNKPYNVNSYFNSIHPIPNNETELRSIKIAISKSGITFTVGSTFEIWGR